MLESTHRDSTGPEMAEDLIESYLDGDLSEIESRRVERRAQEDKDFAAELELARRIQGGLRSMRLSCPPEVTNDAWARIRAQEGQQSRRKRWWSWLRVPRIEPGPFGAWRPAAATLGAALALVFFFAVDPANEPLTPPATSIATMAVSTPDISAPEAGPKAGASATSVAAAQQDLSPAEVEAARREVELAFAYLGRLGRTAEASVRRLATDKPRKAHAY